MYLGRLLVYWLAVICNNERCRMPTQVCVVAQVVTSVMLYLVCTKLLDCAAICEQRYWVLLKSACLLQQRNML